ncbi:hypothetical protein [Ktedonospora formicarum]|uniref:Uncharacterized protein n=1 Tax=Ktedonospora formicarum TaxID=2778364 RepID=A0A8J3MR15_9CHLR|nr:hypothetical protein [Ktedonospora formicarum]GHO44560.1 hypothetical protein KSX_27230 [Ktedonospora formicarum]
MPIKKTTLVNDTASLLQQATKLKQEINLLSFAYGSDDYNVTELEGQLDELKTQADKQNLELMWIYSRGQFSALPKES